MPPSLPYTLRPLLPADIPAAVATLHAAFAHDPLQTLFYARTPAAVLLAHDREELARGLKESAGYADASRAAGSNDTTPPHSNNPTPSDSAAQSDDKPTTKIPSGEHYTAAIHPPTNTLVGIAIWQHPLPHPLTTTQAAAKEAQEREKVRRMAELPGAQGGLVREFWGQIGRGRDRWVREGEMFGMFAPCR